MMEKNPFNTQLTELERAFIGKYTENGDIAFSSTGDRMLDILFMTEYYSKHLNEVKCEKDPLWALFSMFIRDPRKGLGKRDLGRAMMHQVALSPELIAFAGRFDDLFINPTGNGVASKNLDYLKSEIMNGNNLAKKWAPRYSSTKGEIAAILAKRWGLNKRDYSKLVKCDTTERRLTEHKADTIKFEHVPSLALLKYNRRFATGEDSSELYAKFLEEVKNGRKKINASVTTCYDLYKKWKNDTTIDCDLFWEALPKVQGSWLPIIDTSGSMFDSNDSIGKALSIGHYLAKTSTYCPDQAITFGSRPRLIDITGLDYRSAMKKLEYSSDCTNTNLGRVMELLGNSLHNEFPEYLMIMSDMEFDWGSSASKDEVMQLWKERGYKTKIIWWNFNARSKTVPETDDYGNIFLSGYNPTLLGLLESGFDSKKFLCKLLSEYYLYIEKSINQK